MTEGVMDKVREIILFVAAIIAVFSFIFAVYEGANQRVSSATFLGALAIACTFLVFMPKLEVFKVWGIEARLSKTLDRAEEILGKLTRLSQISASATYMQMAWGNRMGTPSVKDKQKILDDIDAQLVDLKVNPAELLALKKPFVQMIGFDFYNLYMGVLRSYAGLKNNDLTAAASQNPANSEAVFEHSRKITPWSSRVNSVNPFDRLDTFSFEEELDRVTPVQDEWLNENERKVIVGFKNQLVSIFGGCRQKGGYTTEAASFYDDYHDGEGQQRKAKELYTMVASR